MNVRRFGSKYGGWHVITELLNNDSIVYSFGVGEDTSFDEALIAAFGLEVFAFDPTPRAISWVESNVSCSGFKMFPFGISDHDGELVFFGPSNPAYVSYSVIDPSEKGRDVKAFPVKRLESIMDELRHEVLDLVKLDIEGAEYVVIRDLLSSGIRPKQLLVEFHHRFSGLTSSMTNDAINSLRSVGYTQFFGSASGQDFGFVFTE